MTCPLCAGRQAQLLYPGARNRQVKADKLFTCTSPSYGVHGPIYRCQSCGFVYLSDHVSPTMIARHYAQVSDKLYLEQEAGRIKTFRRHLQNIAQFKGRRLLDVGAYTGLFVYLAQREGWDASGIEPSSWLVRQGALRYGVRLRQGMLRRGYFPPRSFDIVTLWDVVEHFPTPKAELKICFDYLRPGGWLVMSTVDVGSIVARVLGSRWPWLMQMHRVYFTKQTMRLMLEKVGFTHIHFRPHIRYISLGYVWDRFIPWSLPKSLGRIIIPFYLGDLFDVYAQKY